MNTNPSNRDWRDGEVYAVETHVRNNKEIDFTVDKNINLKCHEKSFYDYVGSRLTEKDFENCNDACLQTSLPNVSFPICSDYLQWFYGTAEDVEKNCQWSVVRDLIDNIFANDEHVKTCTTTKYSG